MAVVWVLQATGATLFFQRVIFDEDTLPSYLDREAFLSWIRPKVRLYIYKAKLYVLGTPEWSLTLLNMGAQLKRFATCDVQTCLL